jgi:hypothetical protein
MVSTSSKCLWLECGNCNCQDPPNILEFSVPRTLASSLNDSIGRLVSGETEILRSNMLTSNASSQAAQSWHHAANEHAASLHADGLKKKMHLQGPWPTRICKAHAW